MQADIVREARKRQDRSKELAEKRWYHSFELPDGTLIDGVNPLPRLRERFARFPIPADLHGKRVLDIGAWDGWFRFEAERRGAAVTAIDCVEAPHFVELQRTLSSKVDYRILDIYELPGRGLGDVRCCLNAWRAVSLTASAAGTGDGLRPDDRRRHRLGPSVAALLAMCRAAGFARVELLHTEAYNAQVACYRKWEPPSASPAPRRRSLFG